MSIKLYTRTCCHHGHCRHQHLYDNNFQAKWDCARILIEKGADLDVLNEGGCVIVLCNHFNLTILIIHPIITALTRTNNTNITITKMKRYCEIVLKNINTSSAGKITKYANSLPSFPDFHS